MTFDEVEEFVWLEPPLVAVEVVEDWVVVLFVPPPWPVFAVEPVEVVVPAVPPEPAPTCDVPPAEVVVVAVPMPVPVEVGVGVVVPEGLCELD